jgi:DNA-binding transcriptional LysR family regulator
MNTNEEIFIKVVESGSLKATAEQLGTDPSTISRKVCALESRLGVKLLTRSTRRSEPTETGKRYYEGIRGLFEQQQVLESSITGERDIPSGLLRVTAPVDFGARFVSPVLQAMQKKHTNLQIELLLGSHYENMVEQGIDVAIRIGQLPSSSLVCRKLGEIPRVLVASPGYLEKAGYPKTPQDLSDHNFVFYKRGSAHPTIELDCAEGKQVIPVFGNFTVNNVSTIRSLILEGHGIHLGPTWVFREHLDSGEVIAILPEYQLAAYPLHALYLSRAFVSAKIRYFIDLIVENTMHFRADFK